MKNTIFIVIFLLTINATKIFADKTDSINSWKDIIQRLPRGEQIVSVAFPENFSLFAMSKYIKDNTLPTKGYVSLESSYSPNWYVQVYPEAFSCLPRLNKPTTAFILVRVRNFEKSCNTPFFEAGFHKGLIANRKIINKNLLKSNWQLVKLGSFVLNKFSNNRFYISTILEKTKPFKLDIAGIILTAKYQPFPRVSACFSPNDDGINDKAEINIITQPNTNLSLCILKNSHVIRKLYSHKTQTPCIFLTWDGKNDDGKIMPQGNYQVQLEINRKKTILAENIFLEEISPWNPMLKEKLSFSPRAVWFEGSMKHLKVKDSEQYYSKAFKQISSQLHANSVFIVNASAKHYKTIFKYAEKYGLKVFLGSSPTLRRIVSSVKLKREKDIYDNINKFIKSIPKNKCLVGLELKDEPRIATFKNLLAAKTILYNLQPDIPDFSCMNCISFISKLSAFSISVPFPYDYYPFHKSYIGSQPLHDYEATVNNISLAKGNNLFWAVLQAQSENSFRKPSPEELNIMVFQALAAGAKGIIYYVYQSFSTACTNGIVDKDLKPLKLFNKIAAINQFLSTIEPELLKMKPKIWNTNISTGNKLIKTSQFKGENNTKYLIIFNTDAHKKQLLKLNIPNTKFHNVINISNNKPLVVNYQNNSLFMNEYLSPGAGMIIKLPLK